MRTNIDQADEYVHNTMCVFSVVTSALGTHLLPFLWHSHNKN